MQNEGLAAPGEPSLEASRVAAVKVRRLAAREQKLQIEQESCLSSRQQQHVIQVTPGLQSGKGRCRPGSCRSSPPSPPWSPMPREVLKSEAHG